MRMPIADNYHDHDVENIVIRDHDYIKENNYLYFCNSSHDSSKMYPML